MDIRRQLGAQVAKLSTAKVLSNSKLEASLASIKPSIDQGYVSRLEHGKHNPSLKTLKALAGGLGVPLTKLMDFEEPS